MWANELKYLGMMFCDGRKFSDFTVSVCRRFYHDVYSINSQCKYANEPVKLKHFESFCLPVLKHGMESVTLNQSQVHALNVCLNDVFVACKLAKVGYIRLYDVRKIKFCENLSRLCNPVLDTVLSVCCFKPEFSSRLLKI